MKILLTGANGLLGAHLLEQLLQKGWSVRALCRGISARSYLHHVASLNSKLAAGSLEIVQHDLSAGKLNSSVLDGVDAVVHAAAHISIQPQEESTLMAVNFEAGKNLFELAEQKKMKRWVQISTTAVLTGPSFDFASSSRLFSEEDFGNLRESPYAKSKFALDQYLNSRFNSCTQVLRIHPGYMLGAWDSKPSSGAILLQLYYRRWKHFFDSQKNFVAPSDVAAGIVQALSQEVSGDFILGGENILISEFLQKLKLAMDLQELDVQALTRDEFLRLPATEQLSLREFCESGAVSSEKAKKAFGYKPQKSVEQMILETIQYFVSFRLLRLQHAKKS